MKIGNKLKGLRIEHGLSTISIAEQIEVSESTYRRYESDKSFPDIYTLDKIAKFYKKNLIEILPDELVYVNNNPSGNHSNNGYIINNYISEKLIEQYEERIKELKGQLEYWKKQSTQ